MTAVENGGVGFGVSVGFCFSVATPKLETTSANSNSSGMPAVENGVVVFGV